MSAEPVQGDRPLAVRAVTELEKLAERSRRVLEDPHKARWHEETRAQLASIEAELARLKQRLKQPG